MLDGSTLVKGVRAGYGWTQQQLADRLKTDVRNVGRWERGEYQPSYQYYGGLQELFAAAPKPGTRRAKRGA
ncbi:hypothetical protein LCGC14_1086260 [marine sediment metagenome]|uniref:HTH cro/C1-type domain-containing protein n=1 Tax=marine sediment metagenome TaxID=412755 RepID=A0A0F9MDV7_9ZZZZ